MTREAEILDIIKQYCSVEEAAAKLKLLGEKNIEVVDLVTYGNDNKIKNYIGKAIYFGENESASLRKYGWLYHSYRLGDTK